MRIGLVFRLYVLWGFVALTTSVTKAAKRKATGRRSRQVFEAEPVEGVWSMWGDWSQCSQSCGVGVSQRTRKCLSPPPPQAPPLSHSPPNWAGFLPRGVEGPAISPARPYFPRYSGQHPSYQSPPSSTNVNPGLPLYRNTPTGGGGASLPAQSNVLPPFYQPEFPPDNQHPASVYQSPYHTPSQSYNQPSRTIRRPTSPGTGRAIGGGSRRSISTNRENPPARRSSTIRPGQFGYGKVPFSLPLHRPNRQARHTVNGTDATPPPGLAVNQVEVDQKGSDGVEEQEGTESPAAEEGPTATTRRQGGRASHPNAEHGRGRERVPSSHTFSRSSSPSASSRRFNWHSVTAPPPPASPLSRPSYPASRFSSPLHRSSSLHRDGDHHVPPAGNVYPLQHLGVESGRVGGRAAHQAYRCSGPEKENRRCFSQVCGGGASDSRAEQCAAFNTQEFMGRLYDWEPFTEVGVDKQCELTCRPAGYRFYVRQAERVRDGTPCFNVSSNDVCVEGQCLTEGCDGVLGSGSVIDKCGVCGGRDASCRKVTGSFQNVSVPLGYHKILDIPPRATFVNITERRASPNYLAMRSGTGASVVNGRWAVDPPGRYQAGGTTFTYTRPRAQAEGEEAKGESLSAPGPTTTQLQLYIIFHKENPGIDYEFYIPVDKKERERLADREREPARETPRDWLREREPARETPRDWLREREPARETPRDWLREREPARETPRDWLREREPARAPLRSSHTVSIDEPPLAPSVSVPSFPSSSSVFSPSSSDRWTSERTQRGSAPNRNARIAPRTDLPLDTQSPFVWRRGELTECSVSCGKGSQHRVILCIDRHTDEDVSEQNCDSASKPVPEEEPCNTHSCPPFWEASAWSECSVSCGPGVQQRQVQCRQSFGQRSTMVQPQLCADLTQPEATQVCQLRLCSHWEVGSDWSTCSVDCGVGQRTRSVQCVSDEGSIVNDRECNSRIRPQGSEECNMGPCVTNWYFTNWSKTCSAQCGPGVQRREVVCLTRGGVREGGEGGECVGEKPAEMKACNGGPCVPTAMWYSSPWTECNVECGNGSQRRDVICVQRMGNAFTVVPASECAHLDKPAVVQECEMRDCQPQWFTTEWSACSRSCGKGLQMREVRCLAPDKSHSLECDPNTKPEQEQVCNTIPCSPEVPDENCQDTSHNCVMVVQARLCIYSSYRMTCCASCTHSALRAKRH